MHAGGPRGSTVKDIEFTEAMDLNLDQVEIYNEIVFTVTNSGTIVMVDRQEGQLLYIDDKGQLINRASSKGQGPGELHLRSQEWVQATKAGGQAYLHEDRHQIHGGF